ncbi:MAG TPA: 4'-phosphopantetheinyl transferase superfamily protein [Aquabacterium sp.]|nr:4'-phosphopantetheinyl transferase superfamily protein [Aquabacterium sp.]HRH28389.1 4'-phosphopantetheinyl transferase superfamily protein [Aquabacterium sp.]
MGAIHLWVFDISPSAPLLTALSPADEARAASLVHPQDQHRYARSRAALRWVLADHTGCPPLELPLWVDDRGKPHLPADMASPFNLSHSGDVAVVAVGSHRPVGVDVETWSQQAGMLDLVEQFMSLAEQDQVKGLPTMQATTSCLRAWTRKEAVLKALGTGLSHDARRVEVGLSAAPMFWLADDIRHGKHVCVQSIETPEGLVAVAEVHEGPHTDMPHILIRRP